MLVLLQRTAWKSKAFRSMGCIDWKGYREQGPLTPPGEVAMVTAHRKGQNLGLTPRVRKEGRPPTVPESVLSPQKHLQGSRKDADHSLEIHQVAGL